MAPPSIFISHAHVDNELCDRYVASLRARGFDVWYDRTNLEGGRSLSAEIQTQLQARSVFIVMLSPAAVGSYWVQLETDAYRDLAARDRSRIMLPVRIAACDVPLLMRGIKWIDATALRLDEAVAAIASALPQPVADKPAEAGATPKTNGESNPFDRVFADTFAKSEVKKTAKSADANAQITISFDEAMHGCQKVVVYPRWQQCTTCYGSGAQPGTKSQRCSVCQGTGELRFVQQSIFGQFVNVTVCDRCKGKGSIPDAPCVRCKGEGRSRVDHGTTVNIPAGVDDGIKVRVTGEGDVGLLGAPNGDLYVAVKVTPHAYFRREGMTILYDLPVKASDAQHGAQVTVPTIDGKVALIIPPGTPNGRVFRLAGKGVVEVHKTNRGDMLVKVIVG